MKNYLRAAAFGLGLGGLALCAGCEQPSAKADEVPGNPAAVPLQFAAADDSKPAEQKTDDSKLPGKVPAPSATPGLPKDTAEGKGTNTTPAIAETNTPRQVVAPAELKLTPALADVIKLVQAGVGEEVLMTYITNSTDVFNMGPDEILYLHDLGVPPAVITTLIQRDSTPEALARKQAASAVQPLPPGVALTTPATNVYPPKAASVPPGGAPAAMETAVVSTNEPPADTNVPGTVVYTVPTVVEQPADVSYFYTELAPYGTWIDYPGYGRCWRPTISVWNSSWRPYADGGRWLWTDYGWYWYSDYSWGSHVFHYGRWTCPPGVGWLWVPDIHWGPAWVSWRYSRSHCGWAPLPPSARWVVGHGFYYNTLRVGRDCDFDLSPDIYVYLPFGRFCDRRPAHYYLTAHHARAVHRESSVFNNYVASAHRPIVNHGVGFDRIASATRGGIRQVTVRTGEPTVTRSTRREQIDGDGRTLTVAPPTRVTPAISSPAKPISSLSNLRSGHERRTISTVPQSATVGRSASRVTTSVTQQPETPSAIEGSNGSDSRSGRPPIIMRGSSRAAGSATATPTATATTRAQPPTSVESGKDVAPGGTTLRRAAFPVGGRTAPATVEQQRGQAAPVRSVPAPTTTLQQPTRTVPRPEPVRTVPQPTVQRAPVVSAPVTVQPRMAPSSPPSRAPMPRTTMPSAPSSPRVESYRAPSPAPSVSRSAPAQSSGGGSRSSRSSGDDGGRRGPR